MAASGDNNRSVRFTKERIEQAFYALLEEKPLSQIRVAEVVRRANVSRSTFYLHYTDILDLTQKIEARLIERLLETLGDFDADAYVDGEFPIAKRVFTLFDQYKTPLRLLLGEHGDISFYSRLQETVREYVSVLLLAAGADTARLEQVLSFLLGGIMQMFLRNASLPEPCPPEELAFIANRYLRATNPLLDLPEPSKQ